jgi:hypothetical protein
MFNLIIVIVSIVLASSVTLASVSYLGGAFMGGKTEATVSAVHAQAQQLRAAVDLHYKVEGNYPASLTALTASGYLKTIPEIEGQAWSYTLANTRFYDEPPTVSLVIPTLGVCTRLNDDIPPAVQPASGYAGMDYCASDDGGLTYVYVTQ